MSKMRKGERERLNIYISREREREREIRARRAIGIREFFTYDTRFRIGRGFVPV